MKNQIQTTKSNSILTIVKYGDPILRKKVEDITDFKSLPYMAEQMFNTMYEENGIGLAANQVGWSLNLLVLDTSSLEGEEDSEPYIFVNSKIINMDNFLEKKIDVQNLFQIDHEKYKNFLDQYIKVPDSPNLPIWEIFLKQIKNKKF